MHDREQSDGASRGRRRSAGRRLQRLELAALGAVDDFPSARTQPFADGVGRFEVLVSAEPHALDEQLVGLALVYRFLAFTAAPPARPRWGLPPRCSEHAPQRAPPGARRGPRAPPGARGRSAGGGRLGGPPAPPPPLITTFASSSFTFSEASTTRSTMCARFEPSPMVTLRSLTSALPPTSEASKDFGRPRTRAGFFFTFL